ncbi:MAG: hypothetical protein CL438_07345 [Acidimicrobiaceae bacterium]|nr:hypothetical protein [Acidimicrobiaceae bacterium]
MSVLLPIHIAAGSLALLCALVAISTSKGKTWHIMSGRIYFWSMAVIFLTALPMAIIQETMFLFLVAIFSFYLAFAGMRFARNRKAEPAVVDWIAASLMISAGLGMWILSIVYIVRSDSQFITLILFGIISISLGVTDFKTHSNRTARGQERIARHLTNMMAGTIAVITAVLVTNMDTEPVWIWWILPTFIITPIIILWNIKIRHPASP